MPGYREIIHGAEHWGGKQLDHIRPARGVYEIPIDDFEAVRAATASGVPLVSQVDLRRQSIIAVPTIFTIAQTSTMRFWSFFVSFFLKPTRTH